LRNSPNTACPGSRSGRHANRDHHPHDAGAPPIGFRHRHPAPAAAGDFHQRCDPAPDPEHPLLRVPASRHSSGSGWRGFVPGILRLSQRHFRCDLLRRDAIPVVGLANFLHSGRRERQLLDYAKAASGDTCRRATAINALVHLMRVRSTTLEVRRAKHGVRILSAKN
jgi:hypothetical protein